LLSYGPFYEAFQTAASGDLTDLLEVEHGNAPHSAGNVMWHVLDTLRLLSQSGPLLLAIDDLQWANSATLRLFGFLATRIRGLPVLLIGTIQHPGAVPAIRRLLAVGRHRGEVHLVHVMPLTLEAVTDALSLLKFDAESVTSLAEWLQDRSGGSPFILGEILSQLRSDDVLTREDSTWHLDAARWLRRRVMFTLPATTHDLLSWRLAPVAPEALPLLEVLAVAGQPLSQRLLRDLLGERAGHVLQQVEDLLARGLLVEAPEDALALPHHLLRETLLSRLSHRGRRTLHRELVAALERSPAQDAGGALRQLALHAVAGEDPDRARRYGLRVMDELLQDQPSAETLRFVHQLHELLAPSAVPLELMKLAHELGRLHQSLGQPEAASHYHQQHLALARQAGDVAAQATAYCEIGELALLTNDYLAAATAASAALQLSPSLDSSTPTGRSYRLLGAAHAMEGRDLGGAVHYLQQAVTIHREARSYGDLCADLFELGNVAAQRGELVEALSLYEEAASAATAGHDYYVLALAHNNIAYHSLLLGRVDTATEAVAKGQRLAETHELVGALLHLYSTQGEIHLFLSEWEKASLSFRRGLALAEELGNLERQAGYRAGLALAMRGQGDYAEAVRLLEEARGLIVSEGYWHLHTRILLYLAETNWLQHRVEEAWPLLEEAASIADSQGRVLLRLQAECLRGELLFASGRQSEGEALFADLLRQATKLGLPLEVARIQSTRGVTLQ
jgi:tetratricopeptide (TPR) repeat protein